MAQFKLQPRDHMMLRITNAFVKGNVKDENQNIITRWRNFSGAPTNNNPRGGNRSITLDLNRKGNKDNPFLIEFGNDDPMIGWRPVTIEELIEMGWKINLYDPRERNPERYANREGIVPNANLNVVIYEHEANQRERDPKIYQYVNNHKFSMVCHPNPMNPDELPIELLDDMWFDRVQIRLNHSEKNTAYLDVMHIYPKIVNRNYDDWAC